MRFKIPVLLFFAVLSGCKMAQGLVGNEGGDNGIVENKKDDPSRPSDDGEGVPGYLVDPSLLVFEKSGGQLMVEAPAKAFSIFNAKYDIYVEVLSFKDVNADNFSKISNDEYLLKATSLEVKPLTPGSSISFSIAFSDSSYIALALHDGNTSGQILLKTDSTRIRQAWADLNVNTKANGAPLTIGALLEKFPAGGEGAEPTPTTTHHTQAACNDAGFYWNNLTDVPFCTSLQLVRLRNCWPTKDHEELIDLIARTEYDSSGSGSREERGDLPYIKDNNLLIDQCYAAKNEADTLIAVFTDGKVGTKNFYERKMKISQYQENIQ